MWYSPSATRVYTGHAYMVITSFRVLCIWHLLVPLPLSSLSLFLSFVSLDILSLSLSLSLCPPKALHTWWALYSSPSDKLLFVTESNNCQTAPWMWWLSLQVEKKHADIEMLSPARFVCNLPQLNQWRPCALCHGIQNSMEAILACHRALSTHRWQNDCTGWQNGVNDDVCALAPSTWCKLTFSNKWISIGGMVQTSKTDHFLNWRHFGLHWRISLILVWLESSWLQLSGDVLRLLIACRVFE